MNDRRSERFGRYEILAELGRGSMGVVYKARDPKINRIVAVKTVSLEGQPAEEELEYRERFFREAEAAGRLSHPGIVTIFDVAEELETRVPYIVMEFVGGQSLEHLLSGNDHKVPIEAALQLTLELADALDCAHGQGVVHRDLKPANILLTEDGHAKIADFGVAKLNHANHTLGGRALGTPAYMSPEQLNGEAVDGRSDLFSLGVILYTILTGYRPFQGGSALTVWFKVVNHDPVRASVLDSDLPRGLDYIIARAMAKDPRQRYQCGKEMALDIQELQAGREPGRNARPPGWSPGAESPETAKAGETADSTARSWAVKQPVSAADSRAKALPPFRMMESLRKNSIASAVLLLGGALGLGIGFSYFVWPQRLLPPGPVGAAPIKTLSEGAPVVVATTPTLPNLAANTTRTHGSLATVTPATLDVEVEHNFRTAHMSVWVDDHPSYTQLLDGADKKHLIVFHGIQGHESHAIQLAPGRHRVLVQVESGSDSYDQSGTVVGEFASGKEKVLRIHFKKRGEMNLSLR